MDTLDLSIMRDNPRLADTPRLMRELDAQGWGLLPGLISAEDCADLKNLWAADPAFRSHIHMARHGFGKGEYKYFTYPLPPLISTLRHELYEMLAPVANRWNAYMDIAMRYPLRLEEFLARCHEAGQGRPTPLLLRYHDGDYNCLHQDLYGEHVFPLQVVVLLSEPDEDFTGGELVLTEQRPRMQSRAEVVPLHRGDGAVIAVHHRPVRGTRGPYRVTMRHGVSPIRSGERFAAGIIFHDAA
jgi:hypothetical protein